MRQILRSAVFFSALLPLALLGGACGSDALESASSEESVGGSVSASLEGERSGPDGGVVPPTGRTSDGSGGAGETAVSPSDESGPADSAGTPDDSGEPPTDGDTASVLLDDGEPCEQSADCAGGTCLLGAAWPDGFCTTSACEDADSCHGEGAFICAEQDGVCLASCSSEDDCRDGYACQGAGSDGQGGFCVAPQSDAAPCALSAECLGGVCLSGRDFPDGYCANSAECSTRDDCEDRDLYRCLPRQNALNVCVLVCEGDEECRDRYACRPAQNVSYCWPDPDALPTEPEFLEDGAACSDDQECAGGRCLKGDGWPEGYCTTPCAQSSDCNATGRFFNDSGALCRDVEGEDLCLRTCTALGGGATCREGYTCVRTGGGPLSPSVC